MPSELERAISRERRRLNAEEAAARKRMRDAYRDVVRRLERDIDATLLQIEAFPGDEWRRYHEQRLRVLLAQAEAEYARFADDAMHVLAENEVRAVSGGAHAAAEMTAAVPATATVGFGANVNRQALERMVASFAPDSPVRGVIATYGQDAMQIIQDAMVQGMAEGLSPRKVRRQIVREISGGFMRARLDTLVRSEYMRSYRASLFDGLASVGVAEWVWRASLSSRSCVACIARSGTRYPMTTPFMPAHPNCRCIPSPYVDGLDIESGPEWFARQPAGVQRTMLPSDAAYNAYADRRLDLEAFVGMRHDPVWGDAIYERSGREALRYAR